MISEELLEAGMSFLRANLQLVSRVLADPNFKASTLQDRDTRTFRLLTALAHAEAALLDQLGETRGQQLHASYMSDCAGTHKEFRNLAGSLGLKELRNRIGTLDSGPGGPSYAIGVNVKVVYCCTDHSMSTLAIDLLGWGCTDNINAPDCPPIA